MSIETYSVTYADVGVVLGRSIAASGRPTQDQVSSLIETSAGDLAGYLRGLGYTPAIVAADAEAKAWCARTVTLHVAAQIGLVEYKGSARDAAMEWMRDYRWRIEQLRKHPEILGALQSTPQAQAQQVPTSRSSRSLGRRTASKRSAF